MQTGHLENVLDHYYVVDDLTEDILHLIKGELPVVDGGPFKRSIHYQAVSNLPQGVTKVRTSLGLSFYANGKIFFNEKKAKKERAKVCLITTYCNIHET